MGLVDKSQVARGGLGDELGSAFGKLKLEEWASYSRSLTEWERQHTLDC